MRILAVLLLATMFTGIVYASNIDYLTNRSVSYFRNFARNPATEGADLVTYNPAGLVFMEEGFHISFGNQFLLKFGPDLEDELRQTHGVSVGHFPQSFDLATVGGWVASRGAGQYSTRYGKIEDMVVGLEVVLADGTVIRTFTPAPPKGQPGQGTEERPDPGPRVIATRSVFYPDTEDVMGWRVSERGFHIVLSPAVPSVARELIAVGRVGHADLRPEQAQGVADADEVARAVVDDRDPDGLVHSRPPWTLSEPLVEATPERRGSGETAMRRARARALKAASARWWSLRPLPSMCSVVPLAWANE